MINDNQNKDFIEKCRGIDFSAESANQEKNLEILKRKLKIIENEGEFIMKKRTKKPAAIVVAVAMLLCFSMAVYGQDLIQIIRTVFIGNHAEYNTVVYPDRSFPIPEELKGLVFDENGNNLTIFPEDNVIYNADGQKVNIYRDDENNFKVISVEEYNKINRFNAVEFYDFNEGLNYFISDILTPDYLPEGYAFKKIEYYADSKDTILVDGKGSKYMNIYYSDGKEDIRCMLRYMDEGTAYVSTSDSKLDEIIINGYDAVIQGNSLDIQIGDIMYSYRGNDNVNADELVKIAESLK